MARACDSRRPQARGRLTRGRVLEAARWLFTRRGYAGTTMNDLAERAGVGVGTVYHHFPDKRSVLLELIDEWGDRLVSQRRTDLDHQRFLGEDPRAGIRSWLRRSYERLKKEPSLYLVVLDLADRDPEVRRRFQRIERLGAERLRQLIEFGQQRGLMRADLEPTAAAFLVHNSIDNVASQLLVRELAEPDPERVLQELGDMLCRYLVEDSR